MATAPNKPYVLDIGTVILLDCGVALTDATVTDILVQKPDKRQERWIGTVDSQNTKCIRFVTRAHGDPGYQGMGLTISGNEDSGLLPNTRYYFYINKKEYSISTQEMVAPITFNSLVTLLNTALATDHFVVAIVNNDIRITSTLVGKDAVVNIEEGVKPYPLFAQINGFNAFTPSVPPICASLDVHGSYFLQAYVETPNWKGKGETVKMDVFKAFE